MNREQAKQLLPIIQAFADGAEVQFKDSRGEWITASDDPGLMYGAQWRISPKPLEGWAIAHSRGTTSVYEDKNFVEGMLWRFQDMDGRVVKFREVV